MKRLAVLYQLQERYNVILIQTIREKDSSQNFSCIHVLEYIKIALPYLLLELHNARWLTQRHRFYGFTTCMLPLTTISEPYSTTWTWYYNPWFRCRGI